METTKGQSKKYFVFIVAVVVAIVVVLSRTKPAVIGDLYYAGAETATPKWGGS